jgi:propanol-preferring alcohol dehydrogenase
VPIRTHVTPMKLEQANEALQRLREGQVEGAIVLIP